MEVIADELQKNNIRIDIETLTEHVQYILNNYRDSYNDSVERLTREELLLDVFHEMNVNTLGRAMAYLRVNVRKNQTSFKNCGKVQNFEFFQIFVLDGQ